MNLKAVLKQMVEKEASDLHLKAGSPPILRISGKLNLMKHPPLSPEELKTVIVQLMTPEQQKKFARDKELDFGVGVPGLARFRVNAYLQRSSIALALRTIPMHVRPLEELNLPMVLKDLCMKPRGMILCTGTTGSGKSTTLAAMIDYINEHVSKNIITIEDPIEFLFTDKKSVISQREIGTDTNSFSLALRQAMRQDPDTILVGEIRDMDTIDTALKAADTGHLVMSTLHTLNAAETINRVISFYPPHQQQHIRVLLSTTLVAVVSLRLIPRADGRGRVPASEVMINTPTIREYILDPLETLKIPQAIVEGAQYQMQSFDQSIMNFYEKGIVSYEDAIENVSNPDEFKLRLRGIQSTSDRGWEDFTA
ncbi:type IV pilus twitching motility protein PilT [candidate division WOR-3 bacterium]|nr:type IV pilus twitching motility protein PilT [candidate division WOR-3 bacterium]